MLWVRFPETEPNRRGHTDYDFPLRCYHVPVMYPPRFPPGAGGDSFPGTWLRHHWICKARLAVSGHVFKSLQISY
jgi:hypothetical protein